MLINGLKINIPFRRDIVIPRVDEDIVFTAVAVSSEKEFESKCKEPQAPKEHDVKGNLIRIIHDDPKYIKQRREYFERKLNFQIIKSLENVVWETVDLDDPETWENWKQECIDSGLSDMEVAKLLGEVLDTHNPTSEIVEKEKKRFLAKQGQKTESPPDSQNGDH